MGKRLGGKREDVAGGMREGEARVGRKEPQLGQPYEDLLFHGSDPQLSTF